MRVQSIWTAVEPRYPARDRFFGSPVEVPLGEMHRVAELHYLAQEVGAMAEALQNARHLLTARLGAPLVVDLGHFAGRVFILNELDLGLVFRQIQAILPANSQAIYHGPV